MDVSYASPTYDWYICLSCRKFGLDVNSPSPSKAVEASRNRYSILSLVDYFVVMFLGSIDIL
ncbi:unnamed protein product [Rodentolepis nana]|uniref:Uncharacterized protein n=1 Tax=Rodentolepis nana TaxID=102285 RepID=A0A0R3TZA6_RODNA|nr:unnamed protein product [Rodentolepis nana]